MHGWPILQMRQDHEKGLAEAIEKGEQPKGKVKQCEATRCGPRCRFSGERPTNFWQRSF